jgi:glutamate synthase (NADPH/NADH) large chain
MSQNRDLYHTDFHDACGIGFITEISGVPSRRVIDLSIEALSNMAHRGANAADYKTSDGTGLLTDIPKSYFKMVLEEELNIQVEANQLAIAMVFTQQDAVEKLERAFQKNAELLNIAYIGKRTVPTNHAILGDIAKATCPYIVQFFFKDTQQGSYSYENKLYILRKTMEANEAEKSSDSFICSLSSKTIVYKGMMKPNQLSRFYTDLNQPEYKAKVAIFHERFSTNTISSWSMAQPFRMLGHNGEINTIKGNRLWMKTREATIQSDFWGDNIHALKPIVSETGSDSYSLDNILEFLVQSGRSLFHSAMMLIPEPYIYDQEMPSELKDFYIYHENHIEPWDGPAALVFTDGDVVGAKLDRNGLRPLRYTLTKDGLAIMASEAGVVEIQEDQILRHHHMKSGENFAIQLDGSGIISNKEITEMVSQNDHYSEKVKNHLAILKRGTHAEEFRDFSLPPAGFDKRLRVAFGIEKEDMERFIIPMSTHGSESIGSMGDDTPPAFISHKNRKFYDYFKQHFAQVTNPSIDSIREKFVMSLYRYIGTETDLLSNTAAFTGAIRIDSPILSPREVNQLKKMHPHFPNQVIKCLAKTEDDLAKKMEEIQVQCEHAIHNGVRILFLSDEDLQSDVIHIPMLLVVSAVHQYLIDKKLRNNVAILCFSGEVIEDHHVASLIAFGASAVYPYMAYELIREHFEQVDWIDKMGQYRNALEKGLLKIMAKMGVSTISSYHGSMLFNAIGIDAEVIKKYFPSIKSQMGGLTLMDLKQTLIDKSKSAFENLQNIEESGRFRYRKEGETHGFAPLIFKNIHHLSQGNDLENIENETPIYIRDLLQIVKGKPIERSQVLPITDVLKRLGLGAVSFGAISEETHRTLARGASLLGIRSNTGEGGEQKDRFSISNPDKSENCYTKQIGSGRFGVTTTYLSAARELQIKIGQGAKPGEGGQLPGDKVTLSIAMSRHTTPGVPLISPPPHHDIYSIEDLAQLIYDLKQVNPRAQISVKLVSQNGVGIIASGVVKAGADNILISGNDGGTGASPLGSVKHTALPWEIGLTEVHRTLLQNNLRNRVTLRVDGGLKTAEDIVKAALLGAEEYDFGTSAVVALGCVMARQCHSNTCPVGIATQDPELRKKFKGKPENLVNYITHIAEKTRLILSEMGYASLDEIIGRHDLLSIHPKWQDFVRQKNIDLSYLLAPTPNEQVKWEVTAKIKNPNLGFDQHFSDRINQEILPALMAHGRVVVNRKLRSTDRSVGTHISGLIAFLYGTSDFKGYIQYKLEGAAGQSLGAFLVDNMEIRLSGVANDYVGKGMSGGLITIRFPKSSRELLKGNTIIGNVALYGATAGEVFIAGKAGERFAIRNSGAAAVVEGVGNHCCEYMTRGIVVVLGESGKNIGAGMTGGFIYFYNERQNIEKNLNHDYVKISKITQPDEELLYKYLVNHEFQTGSTTAKEIIEQWSTHKLKFVKVSSIAAENVDYDKIFNEQFKNRLMSVFKQ